MKIKNIINAGIAALIVISGGAHAALVPNYGAYTEGYNINLDLLDGGLGATSAYVSGGRAFQAQSTLDGSSYTPVLKAEAAQSRSNNPDQVTAAFASAFQQFTYTGTGRQTYRLNLNLHSVASGRNAFAQSNIFAYSDMFSRSDAVGGACGSLFSAKYAQGFDSYLCGTGYGNVNLSSERGTTDSAVISFTLRQGESFYVYANLKATAFDGRIDAFNTFTMNFDDDSNLVASSVSAVPLPASIWLFASGLIGLAGIKRRSKN